MRQTITIDGMTVAYNVAGDGPDMILMHGWGCDSSTLASIEHVAERTHKVYNIDFPGFGASDEPAEVWGVERYTAMLERFVDLLGIKKPVLLGHSFGGRVGLLYSSRHNDVSKLILVDAAGVKPRHSLRYYVKVYSFKAAKALASTLLGSRRAQPLIDRMRSKAGSSDYNSATPMMRAILSRVVNEDLRHVMPLIKAPTLLIWGHNDTATPIGDARIMERLIPGAGLVDFAGCGHYSFLDNPVQFAAVLNSFLTSDKQ